MRHNLASTLGLVASLFFSGLPSGATQPIDLPEPGVALESSAVIAHGSCTYSYESIRGSCNKRGYFDRLDSLAIRECIKWGCGIQDPQIDNTIFCIGNPSCGTLFFGWENFCRRQQNCGCDAGWKMASGNCQEILCEGQYVLGEQWVTPWVGGNKYHTCKGKDNVKTSIGCSVIGYVDEYGCHRGRPP